MTDLFLIRHGIADPAANGAEDDARPLSAKGRRRMGVVVAGLDRMGVRFQRVLHSPKLRAIETAELLTPLLDGETVVTRLLAASPDARLVELLSSGDGAVAAVGHQPYLGELVDLLAGAGVGTGIDWKKGGVVWLRPNGAGFTVRAVLPPGVWPGG